MEKEFKIGDKVKIIGNSNYSKTPLGTIGTIIEISDWDTIRIRFLNGTILKQYQWVHKGDYEHYQEDIVLDVVLEEELVLPNTWYITVTPENREILANWRKSLGNNRTMRDDVEVLKHDGFWTTVQTAERFHQCNTEITFEQFKKYVLKEKPTVEPLPFFKALRTSYKGNITQAQNNEGNIFIIGDKVKGIAPFAQSQGTMTIQSFRYNKTKDNICAITSEFKDYGIGIDKIEHVLEFKKDEIVLNIIESKIPENESNLDKAKRLYPIGTEFIAARGSGNRYKVLHNSLFRENNGAICIQDAGNGTVYYNGKWAEIISKPKVKEPVVITSSLKDMLELQNKDVKNVISIQSVKKFILPKKWFLRFKTREVFEELCLKYRTNYAFYPEAGITNTPTFSKLGDYYYVGNKGVYGEEISYEQFKNSFIDEPLRNLCKEIKIISSQKKETLLEKANRLFPVGTTFKALGLAYPKEKDKILTVRNNLRIASNGRIIVNVKETIHAQAVISADGSQVAEILYNGYKVGDTIKVPLNYRSSDNFESDADVIITKLETINTQEVAFFGENLIHNRILIKNIKK